MGPSLVAVTVSVIVLPLSFAVWEIQSAGPMKAWFLAIVVFMVKGCPSCRMFRHLR